eukprot:gene12822-7173_t
MTTVEIINASIIDNLAKKYVLYTFNVINEDGIIEFTVSKRFSELYDLHCYLIEKTKKLPNFPPKIFIGNFSESNIQKRKKLLTDYMNGVLQMDGEIKEIVLDFLKSEQNEKINKNLKIVILGDNKVGKTTFTKKILKLNKQEENIEIEQEIEQTETVGADVFKSEFNGVQLNIYDTSGKEKYESISKSICDGSNIIIIIVDLTNENCLKKTEEWITYAKECIQLDNIILIGNKFDLLTNEQQERSNNPENDDIYKEDDQLEIFQKKKFKNLLKELKKENYIRLSSKSGDGFKKFYSIFSPLLKN